MPSLGPIAERLDPCRPVFGLITSAINDEPPATLNTMGVIREGYSGELDSIVNSSRDAREWIANLEAQERAPHGHREYQGQLQQGIWLLH